MQELYEHVTVEGVEAVEQQRQQVVEGEGWGLGAVMLEDRRLLVPFSQSQG